MQQQSNGTPQNKTVSFLAELQQAQQQRGSTRPLPEAPLQQTLPNAQTNPLPVPDLRSTFQALMKNEENIELQQNYQSLFLVQNKELLQNVGNAIFLYCQSPQNPNCKLSLEKYLHAIYLKMREPLEAFLITPEAHSFAVYLLVKAIVSHIKTLDVRYLSPLFLLMKNWEKERTIDHFASLCGVMHHLLLELRNLFPLTSEQAAALQTINAEITKINQKERGKLKELACEVADYFDGQLFDDLRKTLFLIGQLKEKGIDVPLCLYLHCSFSFAESAEIEVHSKSILKNAIEGEIGQYGYMLNVEYMNVLVSKDELCYYVTINTLTIFKWNEVIPGKHLFFIPGGIQVVFEKTDSGFRFRKFIASNSALQCLIAGEMSTCKESTLDVMVAQAKEEESCQLLCGWYGTLSKIICTQVFFEKYNKLFDCSDFIKKFEEEVFQFTEENKPFLSKLAEFFQGDLKSLGTLHPEKYKKESKEKYKHVLTLGDLENSRNPFIVELKSYGWMHVMLNSSGDLFCQDINRNVRVNQRKLEVHEIEKYARHFPAIWNYMFAHSQCALSMFSDAILTNTEKGNFHILQKNELVNVEMMEESTYCVTDNNVLLFHNPYKMASAEGNTCELFSLPGHIQTVFEMVGQYQLQTISTLSAEPIASNDTLRKNPQKMYLYLDRDNLFYAVYDSQSQKIKRVSISDKELGYGNSQRIKDNLKKAAEKQEFGKLEGKVAIFSFCKVAEKAGYPILGLMLKEIKVSNTALKDLVFQRYDNFYEFTLTGLITKAKQEEPKELLWEWHKMQAVILSNKAFREKNPKLKWENIDRQFNAEAYQFISKSYENPVDKYSQFMKEVQELIKAEEKLLTEAKDQKPPVEKVRELHSIPPTDSSAPQKILSQQPSGTRALPLPKPSLSNQEKKPLTIGDSTLQIPMHSQASLVKIQRSSSHHPVRGIESQIRLFLKGVCRIYYGAHNLDEKTNLFEIELNGDGVIHVKDATNHSHVNAFHNPVDLGKFLVEYKIIQVDALKLYEELCQRDFIDFQIFMNKFQGNGQNLSS